MPDDLLLVEDSDSQFDDFRMATTYHRDTGMVQIPVAGPDGTPAIIVKACADCSVRVVTWTAQSTGAYPRVPHPLTPELSGNDVLLSEEVSPCTPVIAGDGTVRAHRISGAYTYALRVPVRPGEDNLQTGAAPCDSSPPESNDVLPEIFDPDLLG